MIADKINDIEVRIDGIPAIIDVYYTPPSRGLRTKAEGQMEPDLFGELEIDNVRDRKGYPARWLDAKLYNTSVHEDVIENLWSRLDLRRYP